LCLTTNGANAGSEYNPVRSRPSIPAGSVHHVILKMRANAPSGGAQKSGSDADGVKALAARVGLTLKAERALGARLHAMQVTPSNGESETQTLARLRTDPEVEYAVTDRRVYPLTLPNDPLGPASGGQWYLQSAQPSAINATGAWDITQGSDSIVIALVDTGV